MSVPVLLCSSPNLVPQSTRILKGILLDIEIDKLSLAAVKEKSINL